MQNTGYQIPPTTSGNRAYMDGMSLPELIELLHAVADEIQLRMMEQAE